MKAVTEIEAKEGHVVRNLPWPIVRLGEMAEKIGSGSTPRGGESVYTDTGVPLIRSMNVHFDGFRPDGLVFIDNTEAGKLDHVTVRPTDVLLNITGASIGRVTVAPDSIAGARVNQHVCIIRPKSELLGPFLAYFFASPDQQARIGNVQVGATRQALTKSVIEKWEVPIPPVPVQRRIVAEIEKQFTRLEAGVAALKRVQAGLRRYRAAVLKAACEGGLAEGDRKRWRMERLGQLVTIRYGKMLPTKEFSEAGFPVFGANGIIGYYTRYFYETEQVLISCRGAYSGRLNLSPPKCFITNNSLVLEMPERPRIEKRFLFYVLQAADKSKLVTGSAQPQVTINNADVLDVPVPPLGEQTRIVAKVERRLSVVEELEAVVSASLQRAKRLRQSILHHAFSAAESDRT